MVRSFYWRVTCVDGKIREFTCANKREAESYCKKYGIVKIEKIKN